MSKRVRRIVLGCGLAVTGAGSVAAEIADYPAPGVLIQLGSHRLHLDCSGTGRPVVVLEAGLGGNSLEWIAVKPEIARFTRVCAYDRAGYGWSEAGPLPRTGQRLTGELHSLLAHGAVAPPYILVGHSFGGLLSRLFASEYPQEAAGIVLIDAAHENQFERFSRDGIAADIRPARLALRVNQPGVPEQLPSGLRTVAESLASTNSAYLALQGEIRSLIYSAGQVRATPALPDVPLAIITRGRRVWPDNAQGNRMEQLWSELQCDLFLLSPSWRRERGESVHRIAFHSGHYVHLEEPQIVIDSVRAQVRLWRAHHGS